MKFTEVSKFADPEKTEASGTKDFQSDSLDHKGRIRGRIPTEGNAYNPLTAFPPNHPCFCGSLMKFKKCCRGKIARIVSQETADKFLVWYEDLVDGKFTLKDLREPKS